MSKKYTFPKEFLDLVRTMPWVEAKELLIDRKLDVLERICVARDMGDGDASVDLGYVLSALNDEIKLINIKQDGVRWNRAVKELFGDDGWAMVRELMAMWEAAAR